MFTVLLRSRVAYVVSRRQRRIASACLRAETPEVLVVHVASTEEMTLASAPKRRVSQDEDACAEVAEFTPSPPDGGWGWMVVFASFMIHIVSKYITN